MAHEKKRRSDKKHQKSKTNINRFLPDQPHPFPFLPAIVFGVIATYIIIILVRYRLSEDVAIYEVVTGENGHGDTYEALILRDEEVYTSEYSGYVNYYASTGDRLGVNDTVCSLDENGDFLSNLVTSESTLSDDVLASFKTALRALSISYDPDNFDTLYSEKNALSSTLLSLITEETLSESIKASDEYTFSIVSTPISGIFTANYDGYEDFDIDKFSITQIDSDSYSLETLYSGDYVEAGDPLYKILPNDDFTIIFQIDEDDQLTYWFETSVTVYFSSIDKAIEGQFSFIFDQEGNRYARVDFDSYGYLLANTRYTEIELYSDVVTGLKIPSTSLTTKDYLMIPKYLCQMGGGTTDYGCLLQVYEDGEITEVFTPITILNEYDDYYLIDASTFEDGSILVKYSEEQLAQINETEESAEEDENVEAVDDSEDSEDTEDTDDETEEETAEEETTEEEETDSNSEDSDNSEETEETTIPYKDLPETYEVGAKKTLSGVFCVDKGYAVFYPVNILSETDDGYVIVEEGYYGSINRYDRIAINASNLQEGDVIY